jgi:hypothetical protein
MRRGRTPRSSPDRWSRAPEAWPGRPSSVAVRCLRHLVAHEGHDGLQRGARGGESLSSRSMPGVGAKRPVPSKIARVREGFARRRWRAGKAPFPLFDRGWGLAWHRNKSMLIAPYSRSRVRHRSTRRVFAPFDGGGSRWQRQTLNSTQLLGQKLGQGIRPEMKRIHDQWFRSST